MGITSCVVNPIRLRRESCDGSASRAGCAMVKAQPVPSYCLAASSSTCFHCSLVKQTFSVMRVKLEGSSLQIFLVAVRGSLFVPPPIATCESAGATWFETAGGAAVAGEAAVSRATQGNRIRLRIVLLPFCG